MNAVKYVLVLSFSILIQGALFGQSQTDPTTQVLEKLIEQLKRTQEQPSIQENSRSVGIGSTGRANPPPPVQEIRIYDLADLFAVAPSESARGWSGFSTERLFVSSAEGETEPQGASGGMGGMGGGMFRVQDSNESDSSTPWKPTPTSLIQVIQESIDAKWASEGGKETISWIGSSLVISALPETHASVQKLLDLLQTRWNSRVTFRVYLDWIWLNQKETEGLFSIPTVGGERELQGLEKAEVDRWIEKLGTDANRPARVHTMLHGHNGQTLAWVSGKQRKTVHYPKHQLNSYNLPEITAIHSGAACEVTPMLAHASDTVTLNVRSRYLWHNVDDIEVDPFGVDMKNVEGKKNVIPSIRRASVAGETIAGTVRIPVGKATIVGGGSGIENRVTDYQVYLIAATEFVSPPKARGK